MSFDEKVCYIFQLIFVCLVIVLMALGSIDVLKYISKYDTYTHILLAICFISSGLGWAGYYVAVKKKENGEDDDE